MVIRELDLTIRKCRSLHLRKKSNTTVPKSLSCVQQSGPTLHTDGCYLTVICLGGPNNHFKLLHSAKTDRLHSGSTAGNHRVNTSLFVYRLFATSAAFFTTSLALKFPPIPAHSCNVVDLFRGSQDAAK